MFFFVGCSGGIGGKEKFFFQNLPRFGIGRGEEGEEEKTLRTTCDVQYVNIVYMWPGL